MDPTVPTAASSHSAEVGHVYSCEEPTALDTSQEAGLFTIFIGNPGTGKSCLMNCHIGEVMFQSGLSTQGRGITFRLDRKFHKDRWYLDTPGLSDISLREQAALAIDEALQRGGSFNIVFVMTLEAGRLRPDDMTTMKLVFDACGEQITDHSFSILVNKCSERFLSEFERGTWIEIFHAACRERGLRITDHIHFAPRVSALEDRDNAVFELPAATTTFLDQLVRIEIDGAQVEKVNAQNFQEMMLEMAALTEALGQAQQEAIREAAARRASESATAEAEKAADSEASKRQRAEEEAEAARVHATEQAVARKIAAEEAIAATKHAQAAAEAKDRAEQDAQAAAAARASAEADYEREAAARRTADFLAQAAHAEFERQAALREEAEAQAREEKEARQRAEEALEENARAIMAVEAPVATTMSSEISPGAMTQMMMLADRKSLDTLLMHMQEANWLGIRNLVTGYGVDAIKNEIRRLDETLLRRAFLVEAAKSNSWAKDIGTLGAANSKVAAWRLKDVHGEVVYNGPHAGHHFVEGSWIYWIDKAGQLGNYTL